MFVSQILSVKGHDVVSVRGDAPLAEAIAVLTRHNIGAVLVLDEFGAPAGILSERDCVRAIAKIGPAVLSNAVSDHMTTPVVVCEEDDALEDVAELMTRRRFRHLPVVEHGRVIGIVSIGDVVKSRIEETLAEAEALKDYISARC
jgi:CBS domain-containing protein